MKHLLILLLFISSKATAQNHMVRLAKIQIDSAQLDNYKAFLKEEIQSSLQLEAGVLTLYAVFEKERPTRLTILEIYSDAAAYRAHIETPHFPEIQERNFEYGEVSRTCRS